MPDLKITELDAAAALDGTELIELVQDGENVQSTVADLRSLTLGLAILDFQETAGAGTYTAEVEVAEHGVLWECSVVNRGNEWDADTAFLDIGDHLSSTAICSHLGFHAEVNVPYSNTQPSLPEQYENLKGMGGDYSDNGYIFRVQEGVYRTVPGIIYDDGTTITAELVTEGAGGTTGHTQIMVVGFGVVPGFYSAVKA